MSNYYQGMKADMKSELIIRQIGQVRDKANAFLIKELKRRHMKGIAPTHGDILWALYTYGELPMNKLAQIIGRDKSTVTALVNKLINFKYVEKRTDPADSRISNIFLTEKGRAMKQDFWEVSEALRAKAYQGLSKEQMATLMELLNKIQENL